MIISRCVPRILSEDLDYFLYKLSSQNRLIFKKEQNLIGKSGIKSPYTSNSKFGVDDENPSFPIRIRRNIVGFNAETIGFLKDSWFPNLRQKL